MLHINNYDSIKEEKGSYKVMEKFDIDTQHFKVTKIVWYNKDSEWGVLATEPLFNIKMSHADLVNKYGNVSITGNFSGVYEGAELIISGDIVDGKYGKAIQLRSYSIIHDSRSKEGVVNFLAKSLIKGISVQNAKKIYEQFKEDSVQIVLDQPEKVEQVKGIGKKIAQRIIESVGQYKKMKPLIEYCTSLGLPFSTIKKLDEELGDEALGTIAENPYKVLELTNAITFKQMDEIFLKKGGSPTAAVRLQTGLLYVLKNLVTLEGSTGCKSASLKNKFYSMLNLVGENDEYESTVHKLYLEGKLELTEGAITGYETGYVYYKPFVEIEKKIAEKIKALNTYGMLGDKIREDVVDEEIHDFPFTLNEKQVEAVHECLKHNVSVLTGAAGSGKSSITKALSRIYRRCGFTVYHLSPTAKAARRLEECIGTTDAQTVHKFLGMKKDSEFKGKSSYGDDTVLIIDEASMLDIVLFNYLLIGANLTTRILLIGDNHQLPSVQAGNVLGDLIASGNVHVSELTDVMRQKENSNIIKYCTMINDGEVFDPVEAPDFHYEEFGEGEELKSFFYKKYLEEVKENGLNEVQVITPYKKGELGMDNLNTFIQNKYNFSGEVTIEPYRMGDKVRHTINNYDKDVFNGETGTIIKYDDDYEEILVDYGNKVITYDKTDSIELTLSYVSTVHASQGSEYKIVFVILDDTSVNDFLLIRRLLYTAVSRGKKKVYILTKPYLVDKCITNDSYRPRITKLKEYMQRENELLNNKCNV